jgi:hypothetical protein
VKRVYSDSQVAEALAVLDACGRNVLRASRTTGVPRKTLEGWANGRVQRVSAPEVVKNMTDLRNEKRGQLSSKMEDIAWQLAEAIPDKINNAPLSQTMISLGIAIDKMRLLREESTSITESRSERQRWAQEKLQEFMRDYGFSRGEALEVLEKDAPTVYGLLTTS